MAMTRRDLTKDNDDELHEEAAAVASHDPMPTRRDQSKDNDNELHDAEAAAAHDRRCVHAGTHPASDSKRT